MDNFALPLAGVTTGLVGHLVAFFRGPNRRDRGIARVHWRARQWRLLFLAGLALGGVATHWLIGQPIPEESSAPLWVIVASGLLVGWGTRMGGGCTSGHGVCGLGRRSPRSLVATVTFMALGILTVLVMQTVFGASP